MNKKKLIIIGILIVIIGVGYYLISPLWRNKKLDDPLPVSSSLDSEKRSQLESEVDKMKNEKINAEDAMPTSNGIIAKGSMVAASHDVEGRALIVNSAEGKILRFEDFKTVNGPDLRIYLATDPQASDFVDLGAIRATEGNVNYLLPNELDVGKYKYALVWCRAFNVLFSYSELK